MSSQNDNSDDGKGKSTGDEAPYLEKQKDDAKDANVKGVVADQPKATSSITGDQDEKTVEDEAAELAKKRLASRISSAKTREREKIRLEQCQIMKVEMTAENKKLREQNQRLRRLISMIKEHRYRVRTTFAAV